MDRTPLSALKASVSCESIELPEGQPRIEQRPRSSGIPGTCTGSGAAPRIMNFPLTGHEVAAPAGVAVAAVAAVPAEADTIAFLPSGDARAHRVHDPAISCPGTRG